MTDSAQIADSRFEETLEKASVRPGELDERDLLILIEGSDDEDRREELFRRADQVRHRFVGDEIHLRGLIEFSNCCVGRCLYCGLQAGNRRLYRYRMSPGEIVEAATEAYALGAGTVVLQSGEDPSYPPEELADIVSEIKELGAAVTLSVGERSTREYRMWRDAGADRYLLKHETSDPVLFGRMKPGRTLERRLSCLLALRELGYQVGSGNMVGLPGQSTATLAADVELLRKLDVEMAGIGPFIPHPGTPLGQESCGSAELSLRVLAVTRLALPFAHLPATTALATLDTEARVKALRSGANVIMPNVTPPRYRMHYEIYPGKKEAKSTAREAIEAAKQAALQAGRPLGLGPGHSPKPGFRHH